MRRRTWLVLILCVVVVGGAVTLSVLPEVIRRIAIARIESSTGRAATIERIRVDFLTGRFVIRGFRLSERERTAPFADFRRLDGRIHLPSLLIGHLWLRDLVLSDSTVRVVRLPSQEFNISDLLQPSGKPAGRSSDVTIDHFALKRGTVTLEDRSLPETRTWTSQDITIDARNVSTRRGDGTAVARSVTAGTPVSVDVKDLRLYPIHLRATLAANGLDLTLAQVYLPPNTIVMDRGRATTSITVTLDAREGLHADGNAELSDVAVRRAGEATPLAIAPKLTTSVSGLAFRDGGDMRIAHLDLDGTVKVRDPAAKRAGRFQLATLRGTIADLTWPATTPGRLELVSTVQGGGTLEVTGMLRSPPDPTQLRVRVSKLDLAPWAQLIPLEGRVAGIAEADLRMNEPLAAGIPARVQGTIAVKSLGVADARQEVLGAQRLEARGLEVQWPTRVVIERVLVTGPRGLVERDRTGAFPLTALLGRPPSASSSTIGDARSTAASPLAIEVGEIVVRQGAVAWRDHTMSPPARLDFASIDASIKGMGWPLRGPAMVRVGARPPGGGQIQVMGRIDLEPAAANVRVVAKNAELAPYQSYLPTPARISGAVDLDVALVVPSLAERRATARGTAGLSRLDVRDSERTVARVERASATDLDVDWPQRVSIRRLALTQPWILLERDEKGGFPLRALLSPRVAANPAPSEGAESGGEPIAIAVAQVHVERGGMRVVDRAVSPPFAVDFQSATGGIQGLSTTQAPAARLQIAGQLGPGAELALRGTLGSLGGPLKLDVNGELREFAMPRTNPYLLQNVGWKTTEGRLTTKLQCRIDGDALAAKTNIRLSRLQLVRASAQDGAQARIGLPLGMITSLMKDKRGDITVSFPVGGRLSDPRFDFSEAIWSAVRTVAINAITLPVSWIGRVHFSADSKIERIEVDPVPFEPGTADLTAEGRARVAKLQAFLAELPEVKMTLTPVVSSRDVDELKRKSLAAAMARAPDAAARLFAQRFPGRTVPGTQDAIVAALLEQEPAPTSEIRELATKRLGAVRGALEQTSIDGKRLEGMKPVQQEGAASEVALNVVEPEGPRKSKVRETVDRVRTLFEGRND